MMTTGEKRSLTSSLNKYFGIFNESNPIEKVMDMQKWLDEFFNYWLTNSIQSNVSWVKNSYREQNGFEEEMKERILHMFSASLERKMTPIKNKKLSGKVIVQESKSMETVNVSKESSLLDAEKNTSVKPLRSKKKRIKKKREKKLEQIPVKDANNLKKKMKSLLKKATV